MPGREGQYIDDYRLVRLLGSGTFGEVYLGEHPHTRARTAVKLLKLTDADLKTFVREASIAFRLTHAHIVRLLAFGISSEDIPYLIMDYAPGGTLRHRHPRGTRLPPEGIASYFNPLAAALQYAHERRVIHRDVKPENVLIGPGGELLLSDFGIALTAPMARSISTQDLSGTAPYMAPEQIRGKPQPASDQYALGIMVYEWLCGTRPFQGTLLELLDHHRSSPPPSLRERLPALPSRVEDVLFRALAKDPAQRFAQVQDFALAFQQALSGPVVRLSPPSLPAAQQPFPPHPTPTGTVQSPLRPSEPPSKSPQESRATPDVIAFPTAPPAATSKTRGKIKAVQSAPGHSSDTASPLRPALHPPQSPPTGRNDAVGKMTATPGAAVPAGVASAAGATVAPAVASGPSGPAAAPRPHSRHGRRRLWRRTTLLLLLLSGPLALGILAAQGKIGQIGNPTARVTITPLSKLEADNYLLEALPTGRPDPAQRQIGARLLTQTSGTSSASGNATGSIPAKAASGQLTFNNVGGSGVTIGSGVLTGGDGVQVQFSGPIFIPTTNSVTVTGYAVTPGASGNIAALDIDGHCCASNVFVKNLTAFSGGQSAQPNSVIQQSDIQKTAQPLITSLTQSTGTVLQAQIKSGERAVNQSFQCKPALHPSIPAGTRASTVTVSVQVTCHEEVYDLAGAQAMAATLLRSKAQNDPDLNAQYALQGSVLTSVLNETTVTGTGQVSVELQAQGRWVYRLTDQMQQNIKRALVRLSRASALSVLQHTMGVATATISTSGGELLPTNASDITLVIQAPPGVQASPIGTAGSHPSLTPSPVGGGPVGS